MNKTNLFHQIPCGPNPPKEVYCLVEIPKGTSNKYEYNIELGGFILDRTLYGAVFFPTEYGIIPKTWSKTDKDPLDIMVVSSYPTFPGCLIICRPIGAIRIIDSGEKDNKIIAVPKHDPRLNKIEKLSELNSHFRKEVANFWENYSELQPEKKIKIDGWSEKEVAWKIIARAMKNYQEKFGE